MIPLNQIKVASPCAASWQEMDGTEQVRFCQGCQKNVYNLSEMSQDEAQRLVTEHEGRLCIRFYARRDGTMLTQDCPVGLRAVRKKIAYGLSAAAAVLLACLTSPIRAKSQIGMGFSARIAAREAQLRQMQPFKPLLEGITPPVMMGDVTTVPPAPPHRVLMGGRPGRPPKTPVPSGHVLTGRIAPAPKSHTPKKTHRPLKRGA